MKNGRRKLKDALRSSTETQGRVELDHVGVILHLPNADTALFLLFRRESRGPSPPASLCTVRYYTKHRMGGVNARWSAIALYIVVRPGTDE